MYGELELRNRLFREHQAEGCQDIEELRRIRCEDTDRAIQARIDELSMHQERNPTTVSQSLAQNHDWQNTVNSLSDAREFYDPESGSSSGATHVPVKTLLFWVPEPCRAAILDCRVIHKMVWVLQETFWNDHLLKKDDPPQSSTIQRIWHHPLGNWGLMLQELYRDRRVKWKENRWTRQSPYHPSKVEVARWIILVKLILTVVWLIIRDFRFRNFLTLWNFKAGKSTSRLKFVRKQLSSSHNALDQRGWDGKVNWRTHDISIDFRAKRFPRLRYA